MFFFFSFFHSRFNSFINATNVSPISISISKRKTIWSLSIVNIWLSVGRPSVRKRLSSFFAAEFFIMKYSLKCIDWISNWIRTDVDEIVALFSCASREFFFIEIFYLSDGFNTIFFQTMTSFLPSSRLFFFFFWFAAKDGEKKKTNLFHVPLQKRLNSMWRIYRLYQSQKLKATRDICLLWDDFYRNWRRCQLVFLFVGQIKKNSMSYWPSHVLFFISEILVKLSIGFVWICQRDFLVNVWYVVTMPLELTLEFRLVPHVKHFSVATPWNWA